MFICQYVVCEKQLAHVKTGFPSLHYAKKRQVEYTQRKQKARRNSGRINARTISHIDKFMCFIKSNLKK